MNNKTIVRLSNMIGIVSIILLVYWVFIYIALSVFNFSDYQRKGKIGS